MGNISRFRSREAPRPYGTIVPIGTTFVEKKVNNVWIPTVETVANAGFTSNRLYSFVEKTHDQLNWPGPPYYHGGPFDCTKGSDGGMVVKPFSTPTVYYGTGNIYRATYIGGWCPNYYPPAPFTLKAGVNFDSQLPDLSSYGTQAFKMYSPVKPKVDMGIFLGEFRELPKMFKDVACRFKDVWKMRGGNPRYMRRKRMTKKDKALADDFLQYQFGWVPFISSLIDFHNTLRDLAKYTRRIMDMNGKWEGRGGPVKDELISEDLIQSFSSSTGNTYPSLSSAFNSQAQTKIYKRVYRQIWFHGYMRYYIPDVNTKSIWQPDIFRLILGLNISPSLLWNITPWSWLIDWFGNVGDILENERDADVFNLVSRNSFLMAKSEIRYDFECKRNAGGRDFNAVWTYNYSRKQRVKASPYGFNVSFDALNNTQRAILGALAINFFRG